MEAIFLCRLSFIGLSFFGFALIRGLVCPAMAIFYTRLLPLLLNLGLRLAEFNLIVDPRFTYSASCSLVSKCCGVVTQRLVERHEGLLFSI